MTTPDIADFFSPTEFQIDANDTDFAIQDRKIKLATETLRQLAKTNYKAAVSYGALLVEKTRTNPTGQTNAVICVMAIIERHIQEDPTRFHGYAASYAYELTRNVSPKP